jgi:hypothetical protein
MGTRFIVEEFEWAKNPPPAQAEKNRPKYGKRASSWDLVAEKLKTRPGMWAKVRTNVHASRTAALKKRYPEFKWVARKSENGDKYDIWGSWPKKAEREAQKNKSEPEPPVFNGSFYAPPVGD